MIDILDMIDDTPPEKQSKSVVLYSSSGFLIKDPKFFNRNEKLAYIEHAYTMSGHQAMVEFPFLVEIMTSRGLSRESFVNARDYGLWRHNV